MNKKKKIIIGNWKMAPASPDEAKKTFSSIKRAGAKLNKINIVICPSFLHVESLAKVANNKIQVGVQNIHSEIEGYFTGEVSALQAKNSGAAYVLIGHSERRQMGETNETIAKKLSLAVKSGITGVLCIGERERDQDGNFYSHIKEQIITAFSGIERKFISKSVILAYEPVWAIGRSSIEAMKPTDIHQMSIFIKKIINDVFGSALAQSLPILYGGSVTAENASSILYDGEVDGLLVGRQSLKPEGFIEMIRTINNAGK